MADYVLSAELSLKDKFTAKINEATKHSEKLKEKFSRLEDKIKNFGSYTANFDKFNSKMEATANRVGSAVKKIAAIGVVSGAGLGVGALKIGARFESLSARMETAFQGDKKRAEEYFKWANKFANETPFSNEEVVDATVRLQAYGYDPKRMMTMLGDLAGANAGKTLEQAIEAYADASRGEYERLKEFAITKDEVLNYAKEVMKTDIKKSGEKILDMDTFMKALDGLIRKRSKDGMRRLANTLDGMLSTTSGALKYSVAKLVGVTEEGDIRAGSLMDRVKEKFERFNKYLNSPEGKKSIDDWGKAFDDSLPQIIKLADTVKNKFKEITGENFIEKLNNSIANFDPSKFNTALDRIQEKMDFLMDTALRIGGALAGSKLGPLGTITGFFTPEIIDAKNMVEEMEDDPNGEKAEKYKRTTGGGIFLKFMKHDDIMRQIQEQQDAEKMEFMRTFIDKQTYHTENKNNIINNNNNISINIDGAITNKDDKVAYLDIANQLRDEIQKTIDKSFDNMTTEIEFA